MLRSDQNGKHVEFVTVEAEKKLTSETKHRGFLAKNYNHNWRNKEVPCGLAVGRTTVTVSFYLHFYGRVASICLKRNFVVSREEYSQASAPLPIPHPHTQCLNTRGFFSNFQYFFPSCFGVCLSCKITFRLDVYGLSAQ